MDFDKPKVYGDTFISDSLVYIAFTAHAACFVYTVHTIRLSQLFDDPEVFDDPQVFNDPQVFDDQLEV